MAICLLLAILHTWPLALHPGRYSRNDNADAQLNEWIMAWVAHQLPRDPLHLFEANIFHPAHDALAFSEPLIVPALLGAPLAWAGASPVLVYNIVLILGFALTAFAVCVLVDDWTGSLPAGLAAGSVFAFNAHTLERLPHIQGIHIYTLPVALLAIDRLVVRGTWRSAAMLAAAMVAAAYTSGYLVVFATVMVAIAVLVRVREWLPQARRFLLHLGAAALVSAVAMLPVYLPYARVARDQHMVRTLDAVKEYSATPAGYLATEARLHLSAWSRRFFQDPVNSFFPGFAILALAGIGIVLAWRRRPASGDPLRARALMLIAIGLAGVVLSLGTATPVYGWLFHVFPPMQGLRAAARFGNLFLLAVAGLGGIGLSQTLPQRGGSHEIRTRWLTIALVIVVNAESLRAPFTYQPFTGIPAIYTLLRDEPGPVVVAEQPFFPRSAIFENGPYVLASTAHWRPLMNGYSGYTPASYQHYADAFWYFPEDRAITAMKDAGVTHVVVHPKLFARDHQDPLPAIGKRADFELMAIGDEGIRLYRLKHR
jgi:hypothetical protein